MNTFRRFAVIFGAALALLVHVSSTFAVINTYTSRALFEAAATGPLTSEGFESEPEGDIVTPYTTASGLIADVVAGDVLRTYVTPQDAVTWGFENTTPAGENVLGYGDIDSAALPYSAVFAIEPGMTAIGFDISGFQPISAGSGGFTATFNNNGAFVDAIFVNDATDFSVHFHGLVTDFTFDEVEIEIGGTFTDYAAFDEVTFNVVPEPSALALLMIVLAALRCRI